MLAPDSSSCSLSLQLHYLLLKSTLVSHDQHKNAEKKNRLSNDSEEAIIYVKPEDEIFHKLCSWSFNFPFHAEQVTAHELKNYQPMGLVMAVEADKISTFREQLHSLIDEP
ncbi:hypothetical protein BDE02_11G137800 [Populus trichocarpa]|nr:hypothetical protein BDE02_11G137800 [Populus trichocarpa]